MSSTRYSTARPFSDPEFEFELGWDYAHFRLLPPPEHLLTGSPVRSG